MTPRRSTDLVVTALRAGSALSLAALAGAVITLTLRHPGEIPFAPRCAWWTLTGLRCPGCGLTRALHALLQGDLTAAVSYNPTIVVIPPLFALLAWILGTVAIRGAPPRLPEIPARVAWTLPVLLAGFWLFRTAVDLVGAVH